MYWHPRVEIPNQVPECDIPSYTTQRSTEGDFFLAVVEAKGKGGKTSAFEVKAEGEVEGVVFCILVLEAVKRP